MAVKPYFYKQTDSRWAKHSWRGVTIGGSGCGPTAISNVVSPLVGKKTPKTVFDWICKKGYMTRNDGTYWAGITAGLKHFGIQKFTVTSSSAAAKKALKKGHWLIGVVAQSRWTSGGHYIVVYKLTSKNKVLVSDSASSSDYRQKDGSWAEFKSAERQMWISINPADYKKAKKNSSKSSSKKSKKAAKPTTYILYVGDSKANVRKGRGTNYGVKTKLKRGTKVKVYSYKNGWYRIYSGTGKGGYIHESTLSKYKQINRRYKVVSASGVNVRSGYSKKTKVVKTIAKGSTFKATKLRGWWVYSPALKGWVKAKDGDDTLLKQVK